MTTNIKTPILASLIAVVALSACGGGSTTDSRVPINTGNEPATEQPTLEPGDELSPGVDTTPIDLQGAPQASDRCGDDVNCHEPASFESDVVVEGLPVNNGAEPAIESPVLEPGDESVYDTATTPIELPDK